MQRKTPNPLIPLSPASLTFGTLAQSQVDEDYSLQTPRVDDGFIGFSEGGFIYSVDGKTAVGTAAGGFAQLSGAV